MAKTCCNCGSKLCGWFEEGLLYRTYNSIPEIKVCYPCIAKFRTLYEFDDNWYWYYADDIKRFAKLYEEREKFKQYREENQDKIKSFKSTMEIKDIIRFNNETKEFVVGKVDEFADLFKYEDIIDYELLKDGNTIVKGSMGSALIGGALFGTTGAIVGSAGKKQKTIVKCRHLLIRLTLRNTYMPICDIYFIDKRVNEDSNEYRTAFKMANDCISYLKIACDIAKENQNKVQPSVSHDEIINEIRKYKQLLDDGILTEEEFIAKKKQMLGI